MMECIFCKIASGEIEAKLIYKTNHVVAFKDINPAAAFHALIIPKKHIPTVNEIEKEDSILLGEIIVAAKKIAKQQGIDKDGYRLVFNCNENGGQTVFHIHCHILGGQVLGWPPFTNKPKI